MFRISDYEIWSLISPTTDPLQPIHFMPVPGTEIVRRIADFAASINGSEKEARARAMDVANEIEKLLADQSDAFRELAQHYEAESFLVHAW